MEKEALVLEIWPIMDAGTGAEIKVYPGGPEALTKAMQEAIRIQRYATHVLFIIVRTELSRIQVANLTPIYMVLSGDEWARFAKRRDADDGAFDMAPGW